MESRDALALAVVASLFASAGVLAQAATSPQFAMRPFASESEFSDYVHRSRPDEPGCVSISIVDQAAESAAVDLDSTPPVIRGSVTGPFLRRDAIGEAVGRVARATVSIDGYDLSTTTDSSGHYEIQVPRAAWRPGDSVTISARHDGFRRQRHRIALPRRGAATVDFAMCWAPISGVEGFVYRGAVQRMNQDVNDVDDGDLVKQRGEYIVALHRRRLISLRSGARSLRPISVVRAYDANIESQQMCFSLYLVGDRVLVVGNSFNGRGSEVLVFLLDSAGALHYRSTSRFHPQGTFSGFSTARVVGRKLVLAASRPISPYDDDARTVVPTVQRWTRTGDHSAFEPLASVRGIYRTAQAPVPEPSVYIHSVTTCDPATEPMRCEAQAALGGTPFATYISAGAVYFWTAAWTPSHMPTLAPGLDSASAMLLRFTPDGAAPCAIAVAGTPANYFAIFEGSDGSVNALVQGNSGGSDFMATAQRTQLNMALLHLPLAAFGDGTGAAPLGAYAWLPVPDGDWIQTKVVGDHLVYGATSTVEYPPPRARSTVFVVPLRGGDLASIELAHGAEIIAGIGLGAAVAGNDGQSFRLSEISMDPLPHRTREFSLESPPLAARRIDGLFYHTADARTRVLGLPVRGASRRGGVDAYEAPAAVIFLREDGQRLAMLGQLDVAPDTTMPAGISVQCADWLGTARPLFVGERVFALLGSWLVEGRIRNGSITEVRRVELNHRTAAPGTAELEHREK